ncbi:hypothetical protein [Leptospira sp. GIMC2001]|uniref:hypothetical protein n=1 Tax=Leptospira sp. GIMC2001 TaxID=1513297 RepID=UPI0023491226|nr:hypothetical protein [Leptospira sp. GIMC2001]WCL48404.1 hypothetical protein O4O04_13960 [Leptospira sp. GIMC2001]
MKYSLHLITITLITFLNSHNPVDAKDFFNPNRNTDLIFYGGYSMSSVDSYAMTANSIWNVTYVLSGPEPFLKSDIYVMGLNRELNFKFRFINFELESHIGKHTGLMHHLEWNTLYVARINDLFGLPLSFAVGEGISVASENPKAENINRGYDPVTDSINYQFSIESRNIMNYLMFELEFGDRDSSWPRLFTRIHHRSGVFGLYCDPSPACGSNYFTVGLKIPLGFDSVKNKESIL